MTFSISPMESRAHQILLKSKWTGLKIAILCVDRECLFTLQNLEEEIKKWMIKYDTELEEKVYDIQRLQANRAKQYKELEDLTSLVCLQIKYGSS